MQGYRYQDGRPDTLRMQAERERSDYDYARRVQDYGGEDERTRLLEAEYARKHGNDNMRPPMRAGFIEQLLPSNLSSFNPTSLFQNMGAQSNTRPPMQAMEQEMNEEMGEGSSMAEKCGRHKKFILIGVVVLAIIGVFLYFKFRRGGFMQGGHWGSSRWNPFGSNGYHQQGGWSQYGHSPQYGNSPQYGHSYGNTPYGDHSYGYHSNGFMPDNTYRRNYRQWR